MVETIDVTFCIEASMCVSSSVGGVSAKRVSQLASFKEELKMRNSEALLPDYTM